MKKVIKFVITFILLLTFSACSGNYAYVNLREPIQIPEDGIIEKSVFNQIKEENAIVSFVGVSNEIDYEWTVFGSDIEQTCDVNFSVDLNETDEGIKITFHNDKETAFPMLLSVHLNEKWDVDSATAYENETPIYSVSLTGSKTSILNLSINKYVGECEVIPDVNITTDTQTTTNNSSSNKNESDRNYSDGKENGKDKYETDPVPQGKPLPVEPENQDVNKKKEYTCTFSIECSTILNNLSYLDPDKLELIPSNGVILAPTKVTFYEGESVYDVLVRICKQKGIHMESSWTPVYNSAYIEGIYNLYEFDCGELSGWMYRVDGWYPNYGCSRYQLADGEVVEWRYTCDLGKDVGHAGW